LAAKKVAARHHLYLPERDATVSALFLAELMAWHGRSLGELLAALHSNSVSITTAASIIDLKRGKRKKSDHSLFEWEAESYP